jgi:hypothetical protein
VLAASKYLIITTKIASVEPKFGLNDVFLDVDLPIHSEVMMPFEGCCENRFCRPRLAGDFDDTMSESHKWAEVETRYLNQGELSRYGTGQRTSKEHSFSRSKTLTRRGPKQNIAFLYLRHSTDT